MSTHVRFSMKTINTVGRKKYMVIDILISISNNNTLWLACLSYQKVSRQEELFSYQSSKIYVIGAQEDHLNEYESSQ